MLEMRHGRDGALTEKQRMTGGRTTHAEEVWEAGYAAAATDALQVIRRYMSLGSQRENLLLLLSAVMMGGIHSVPKQQKRRGRRSG